MHLLRVTNVLCCTVFCFQLSTVAAVREWEKGNWAVKYTRKVTDDSKIEGVAQLTDVFQFWVTTRSALKAPTSLYLFDSEEKAWVEASVKQEGRQYCYRSGCRKRYTLSKPLIGYEMLKSNSCGGEGLKEQPFSKGRWGYVAEKETRQQCYMITVGIDGKLISQMHPSNCAEKEASLYKKENQPVSRPVSTLQNQAYGYTPHERFSKRQVISTSLTQFNIRRIGNMRKFVCGVAYSHLGYPTNLGNNIPNTDVKVYYRPHNNVSWGSHLLDLQWDTFVNGVNKFVSWVSKQHLNNQGVHLRRCFKCEVVISGVVTRRCRGGCTCN